MSTRVRATLLFAILLAAAAIVLLAFPPVLQDESYHQFADQRTIWSIPNFWNVVSNVALLAAGLWGIRALGSRDSFREPWEPKCYGVLLTGVVLAAFGSAYYHWQPNDRTLVWDRLPMTVLFVSLFDATLGERVDSRLGRLLLASAAPRRGRALHRLLASHWRLAALRHRAVLPGDRHPGDAAAVRAALLAFGRRLGDGWILRAGEDRGTAGPADRRRYRHGRPSVEARSCRRCDLRLLRVRRSPPRYLKYFWYHRMERSIQSMTCFGSRTPWPSRG